MQHSYFETLIGLIIILFVIICAYCGYQTYSNHIKMKQFKTIYATFIDVDGINKGSGIFISGIQVGVVEKLTLVPKSYDVRIALRVNTDINIPVDSQAVIMSQGLLGNKRITVIPGNSEDYLADQGEIKFTKSALNVEELISKLLLSFLGRSIPTFQNRQ